MAAPSLGLMLSTPKGPPVDSGAPVGPTAETSPDTESSELESVLGELFPSMDASVRLDRFLEAVDLANRLK